MKRFSSIIPVVILFGGLFLSCTSKDQFQQARVQDSVFSINELEFHPLGESFVFTYSADRNWQISKPDWLDISPDRGQAGTYEIRVSAPINNAWVRRTGSIEVDAHQIQVSQDCPYLRISYPAPQENTLSLSEVPETSFDRHVGEITARYAWNHSTGTHDPFHIKVESNVEWEMILDEGFDETYFLADTYSEGTHEYTEGTELDVLSSRNNFMKDDLVTHLTFRAKVVEGQTRETLDDAIANYHVTLLQDHLLFLINGEADDVTTGFDELGYLLDANGNLVYDRFTNDYQVQCEIPWEVQLLDQDGNVATNSFVQHSVSYGDPEDKLTLGIAGRYNPLEEQREMIVRLSAADGEAFRDIRITQRPYIFEIDADETADREFDNGELENRHGLFVHTSGAWNVETVETDPQWLSLDSSYPSTTSGEDSPGSPYTSQVLFYARTQNLYIKKSAQSYLRFTAVNGLVKDIPITQKPFALIADYDSEDLKNISATRTNERKTMLVTVDGPWTLKQTDGSPLVDTDWYAVSSTHSDDRSVNQTIRVGAAMKNPSETADRTFTMLLTSDIHEGMSASDKSKYGYDPIRIILRQRPFTFLVNGKQAGAANQMTIPAYKVTFTDFLNIDCDADWTIEQAPSWIHPSRTSGSTDWDDLLNPDINLEKTSRNGTVVVKCVWDDNVRTIEVDLTQEAIVFEVSRTDNQSTTNLDPDINYESHKPMSFGFRVNATEELPWRLSSSNTSFIPNRQDQSGSGTFTVSPTYNAMKSERTAVIYVMLDSSKDSRITKDYSSDYHWQFSQKAFEFDEGTATTVAFRALGDLKSGSKNHSFKCSGPWEVTSCPSWIHPSATSGTSNPSFELVVDNNLNQSARSSSQVTVRSLIGGYTRSIPVTQDGYYYGFTSPTSLSLSFDTVNPSKQTIRFRSSGPWELEGASGWGFSKTSGEGNDTGAEIEVTVTPDDYLKLDQDHTGTVTLKSSYGGTSFTSQRLTLKQDKYVFNVNQSSLDFASALKSKCTSSTVSVSCTANWKASTTVAWLKISNDSGSRNGSFSVAVNEDNLSLSSRSTDVMVVTTTSKGTVVSQKTVTVTQPAYQLSVNPTSYEFSNTSETKNFTVTCTGSWAVTVTSDPNGMISSYTKNGTGNGTISITTNANNARGSKAKEASLQLKAENSNNLVTTITLKQKN